MLNRKILQDLTVFFDKMSPNLNPCKCHLTARCIYKILILLGIKVDHLIKDQGFCGTVNKWLIS